MISFFLIVNSIQTIVKKMMRCKQCNTIRGQRVEFNEQQILPVSFFFLCIFMKGIYEWLRKAVFVIVQQANALFSAQHCGFHRFRRKHEYLIRYVRLVVSLSMLKIVGHDNRHTYSMSTITLLTVSCLIFAWEQMKTLKAQMKDVLQPLFFSCRCFFMLQENQYANTQMCTHSLVRTAFTL